MEKEDSTGSPLELRLRQKEAVDAAVFALEAPPGGIPAAGLRTQVVAAPGSGKTLVAYEVARRTVPRGRVLVLVPTLNLLVQTVTKWREYGMRGQAVAVCSLDRDPEVRAYLADELDVRCTTNPIRLAMWAGTGPVTIFATYASLVGNSGRPTDDTDVDVDEAAAEGEAVEERAVAGVLERALAGNFGQQLDGFGLAVVDEAHRTAGLASKPWAVIHDNTRIPADRRLYMTATPRIWETGGTGSDGGGGEVLVASMDDEALYGKPAFVYPLGQAIEEGVLASFEIDVLEIRDPAPPGDDASLEERRGMRLGAIRAAALAHMETAGVVSLLSFHSRTQEALSFARGLPDAADELRAAGRFPGEIWGEWLCGLHPAAHQRAVLDQIANGVDAEGHKTEFRILCTCRLLGEGTDITGRCGLDGVLFADVRSSPVDIVQSVGRALRQAPHEGKVARLVVPVLLAEEDEGRDMAATAAFEPLVKVLRALRSFDPRIIEQLSLRPAGRRSGTAEDTLAADPHGDARQTGTEPAAEDAEPADDHGPAQEPARELPLLHFSDRGRDAEEIARLVRTRVLRPESTAWLTGLEAVRTFAAGHGHANVPYTATVHLGDQAVDYQVGQFASEQRRAWRHGDLADWRTELLAETGFVFDPRDQAFTEFLDVCALYFAGHHTLAAPRDAVLAGVAVGERLHQVRKPGGLGKKRATARRERLEAIDPDWNPAWPLTWQRHYAKARWLLSQGATPGELQPGVHLGGDDVGAWLAEQPAAWHTLTDGQQQRLAALGIGPAPAGALPAAVAPPAGASRWEINLAAARQFKAREGHLRVPRAHTETVTGADGREHRIRLGVFRSNTRTHHNQHKLTSEQAREARTIGLLQ
ncbi:Helicase associated domain protein (plasmid) [Streptomyces sp. NBC_01795]|uniref:DEAD/DEAH box helicase n=1 Tax=unclassified Streptomyces TaxID=2593676 RepID=UPI002DDA78A2|nr:MULTISPECIES: Helicase associated domain protein [unclassified Streptomyces]WSA97563.1 Helicase associated domain protein [Streptomyces sp. NBC_01795]WSB82189.1 Helicase associated domain protein [Streptomyces sp. NBC_01775]WSS18160.1 Helicase associated domain protein [Streptomyces sp. NBC_01186]